jgi:hypothetical protein
MKRRYVWLSVAAATGMLIAGVTVGTIANATLAGTTFEGNDGNTVVDTVGNQDWVNAPNLHVGTDQATGQSDNSFTQGSKEDDVDVVIGLGSIPNSKADLGKFGVASETITGGTRDGHVMMYLAWTRNNLSGTTNFDFEINQLAQPNMVLPPGSPDTAIHLNRTGNGAAAGADDILINYDIQGGAQNPTLSIRSWTGTQWGAPTTLTSTNSEGRISSGPVVFDGVSYPAAAFGEASIDLTAAGIIPNQNDPNAGCIAFGSAYVKSRSSSAFTAQMKDYIAPIGVGLDTCASLTIVKQTTPDGSAQTFNFNASWKADFLLSDGQSNQTTGLTPGNYTVTEDLPAGWTLDSATCDDGTNLVTSLGVVNLSANEDVICTFNNSGLANLHILKETNPRNQAGVFGFTAGAPLSPATFNLSDDGVDQDFLNLAAGTYIVDETSAPAGFALSGATCTNGDDPTTTGGGVTLAPGDDVTCTFTNDASASIHYIKTADRDGASFDYTGTNVFSLVSGGAAQDYTGVSIGNYTATETVPDGWNLVSQDCDNGQTAASVDLVAGDDVTCTFVNALERGAIDIAKTTVKGNAPLADVTFHVFDVNGAEVGSGTTGTDGHACIGGLIVLDGPFSISEDVPAGYADVDDVTDIVVPEGDCDGVTGAPVDVPIANTPLTDIHIQVNSQVVGGTASTIVCDNGASSSDPLVFEENPTLDSLDLVPGTYVCTIVIDP